MVKLLSDFLYADEALCVENLLAALPWDEARSKRISAQAAQLVERVRGAKRKTGELESFLQQYGLDTEEGLALMTLAEALLRIPDAPTADALIRDKMAAADWLAAQGGSKDLMVKAAGIGLSLARRTLDSVAGRLGEPVIRKAMVEAMRMMGRQFVLGRTIEEGLKNAEDGKKKGYRFSFDMLGEGARTLGDAQRYFDVYMDAARKIGAAPSDGALRRSGLSVKLSALYPRYEFRQGDLCIPALSERLAELAHAAAQGNISLTVDAEEVDRLETSLAIIESAMADKALDGWEGFGLAVQAYSKRCLPLIDHVSSMARRYGRRLEVRLVKGAYWDTEIKRAQVQGLTDYPVFTRKVNTDLSYMACAARLLDYRDHIFPMFATHNAHSVAAIIDLAGSNRGGFEFQRLHGMGETLHNLVLQDGAAPSCIYAPCGTHEDLLPYLVRRLLENGANSSFVNMLLDPDTPAMQIAADPVSDARAHKTKRHPKISLPADIYGTRLNSSGVDITEKTLVEPLLAAMKKADGGKYEAAPLIGGKKIRNGEKSAVTNPADHSQIVGHVWQADEEIINNAFIVAKKGYAEWSATPAAGRADALERFGTLMEKHRAELMGLLTREAGKTVDDALSEVREAIDFARYYAMNGRRDFAAAGHVLPGPTGESNVLTLHGRGVFVCVSPWNFPLAIFVGQVTAALMAGNAVLAKPASPTPLIAMRAVELMHEAGIPGAAVNLLPCGGKMGGVMVAHNDTAGVAFTGSTEVGWQINRSLAARNTAIAPLIAETGGQNAMIVDSSALPEQIVDDVLVSAFSSCGQRCSALRVLYVQEDISDRVIGMIKGALAQRRVGDPMKLSSDIGPAIDVKARNTLEAHRRWLDANGRFIAAAPLDENLKAKGSFFAPVAYEIDSIKQLEREIFGPVLHVVRFRGEDRERVIADINETGFGLTGGLHTRISTVMTHVAGAINAGNIYINRSMIGAVVGVQPFGGMGLSGTGPKAGGPHYLHRFATEKVVSTDTTRQGGNATLVSLSEA